MIPGRPTIVAVDGFNLNDDHAGDVGGLWKFESITGWHQPAGVDLDQIQRIVSHGEFSQPGHRTGRVIAITGRINAPRDVMPRAIDHLASLLADGSSGVFEFVDRMQGSRWVPAQLGPNGVRGTWDGSPTYAYQLELLSPDPYKYGATRSEEAIFAADPVGAGLAFDLFGSPGSLDFGVAGSTGVVTLRNDDSTAPSAVRFSVEGPTPAGGFVITDTSTGDQIRYLGVVPSGSTLVLDGATGTVVIDGVADRLGDTIVPAWPSIPPRSSRDFLFTPIGGTTAAVLTASTTATYW